MRSSITPTPTQVFTTAAAANAYLDSLNPVDGGTRPDTIGLNTNYNGAIQTALANWSAIPGASNQVFFLSDGNPNQQTQFGSGFPPAVVNSLLNATATAWNSFVDGNNVNVTVIGVDNNPLQPLNLQRLADVDVNSAPDNVPILVNSFSALVATLIAVVVPTHLLTLPPGATLSACIHRPRIAAAARRIAGHVRRTPLLRLPGAAAAEALDADAADLHRRLARAAPALHEGVEVGEDAV